MWLAATDEDTVASSWRWRGDPGAEVSAEEEEERPPVFDRRAWKSANLTAGLGLLTGAVGLAYVGMGGMLAADGSINGDADTYRTGVGMADAGAAVYFVGTGVAALGGLASAGIAERGGARAHRWAGWMALGGGASAGALYWLTRTDTLHLEGDPLAYAILAIGGGSAMAGTCATVQWRSSVNAGRRAPGVLVLPVEDGAIVGLAARW
jgi:hypothetical protein